MILKDKVAMVTGAVGGLGLALSRSLLLKGCQVCLVDIDSDSGECKEKELKEEFGDDGVMYINCDVTDAKPIEDALDRVVERYGAVHIMCNNAGVVSEYSLGTMVDINVKGTFFGTTSAVNRMRRDKGGQGGAIVNISSDAGVYPAWMMPGYSGTKAAIINFTRAWSMNKDRDAMGITFNTVCPCAMATPMIPKLQGNVFDIEALNRYDDLHGFLSTEKVAAALCRLIEEDRNGDVLYMSNSEGERLIDLPRTDW